MIIDGEDDEYSDEDGEADVPSIGAAPIKTALPPRSAAILPAVAPATPAAAASPPAAPPPPPVAASPSAGFLDFLDRPAAKPAIAAERPPPPPPPPPPLSAQLRTAAEAAMARALRPHDAAVSGTLRDTELSAARSGARVQRAASDLDGAAETLRQLCAELGTLGESYRYARQPAPG